VCCYNKSFASHPQSAFWSNKNEAKPRQIFKQTSQKYIFDCIECNHEFFIRVDEICNNGKWCSYCTNKKLCMNKDCDICFNKSFASNYLSRFWSEKNEMNSRAVFKGSDKKFIFNCDKCKHEFTSSLNSITSSKTWCPYCKHKTELKLYNWLNKSNYDVIREGTFDWGKNSKTNRFYKYDFVIKHMKIIIELDGEQHFKQVSNWGNVQDTQERDKLKMDIANQNGYSVIRLLQKDVFFDKDNWMNKLIDSIRLYSYPCIIFASSSELYNVYK
jgi:very-short-patch-repair endonuclease